MKTITIRIPTSHEKILGDPILEKSLPRLFEPFLKDYWMHGDVRPLVALFRSDDPISADARNFFADILEDKVKRPRGKPRDYDQGHARRKERARQVLLLTEGKVEGLPRMTRKDAQAFIATQEGVKMGTVRKWVDKYKKELETSRNK